MTTDPSTLARIKKLLALATNNDQPAEAAAALAKAQAMMADAGVSMATVQAPEFKTGDVGTKMSVSRPKSWELDLMATVAKAFGGKILWVPGWGRSTGAYRFLAEASRLELMVYTATVLQRRLYAARARFLADLPARMDRAAKSREVDGYCTGWVVAIRRVVVDFALPPAEAAALAAEEKRRVGGEAKTSEKHGSAFGRFIGLKDGAKESLHRPMSDDTSPIRRLA